ncbi:hypothetical protein GCM10009786_05780 [Leucobacter alluvii]|uniref:Uncharacterized protein n=1 Tax=Leucobacter alluvii TaxID=340321 RepID=A0ABP5MTZ2_9MICO
MHGALGALDAGEHRGDLAREEFAELGQPRTVPVPHDEIRSEMRLERAQVVRHCRHAVPQCISGARQAPVLAHGEEHSELLQGDHLIQTMSRSVNT